MPNENRAEDHYIIEITSGINAAIHSAISNAIGKAPLPIKAGLYLFGQSGGILQVGIASGTDNQGKETAEFIRSIIGNQNLNGFKINEKAGSVLCLK